jgi:hypothetical protein
MIVDDNNYLEKLLNLNDAGYILAQNDGVADLKDIYALIEGLYFWTPVLF